MFKLQSFHKYQPIETVDSFESLEIVLIRKKVCSKYLKKLYSPKYYDYKICALLLTDNSDTNQSFTDAVEKVGITTRIVKRKKYVENGTDMKIRDISSSKLIIAFIKDSR